MWTVVTVYSALIFAGYWLTQPLEAWLIFWFLLMVHGLLWLQLVLVAVYGIAFSVGACQDAWRLRRRS